MRQSGSQQGFRNEEDHYPQALPTIFDAYKRRHQKVMEVRSSYRSQKMEAQYRCANIQDSLHHLRDSFEKATREKKVSQPADVAGKLVPSTKKRQLRLQANVDMDMLHQRVQDLTALMEDLKNYDSRVENAERAFDNASRAIYTALEANSLVSDDGGWTEASLKPSSMYRSERSTSSASSVLPELAMYCDTVGDLKIMRERLHDLLMERQEQWERHVILADQEGFHGPNNEDFNKEWRQSLEIAEKDLHRAKNVVVETRQSCLDAQIPIPTWAAISISSNATDEEPRVPHGVEPLGPLKSTIARDTPIHPLVDGVRVVSVISSQPVHRTGSPLLTPPINQAIIREKVDSWLDSVEEEVIATTSEQGDHERLDARRYFEYHVIDPQQVGWLSSPGSLA
jgi:hypothetical protein